jgi:hypothetical protein
MTQPKPDPTSDAPFGTEPRRPAWPLICAAIVFALWFSFLVFIAIRFPAR